MNVVLELTACLLRFLWQMRPICLQMKRDLKFSFDQRMWPLRYRLFRVLLLQYELPYQLPFGDVLLLEVSQQAWVPLCLACFDEQRFGALRVRPVPQGLHRPWDSFAERSC
jgi:hypothetical protein